MEWAVTQNYLQAPPIQRGLKYRVALDIPHQVQASVISVKGSLSFVIRAAG